METVNDKGPLCNLSAHSSKGAIAVRDGRVVVLAALVVFVVLGATLYRDYGHSSDERVQRDYGLTVWRYVFNGDRGLDQRFNSYHGPIFPTFATGVELVDVRDTADAFALRHLLSFLSFVTGVAALYALAARRFQSR